MITALIILAGTAALLVFSCAFLVKLLLDEKTERKTEADNLRDSHSEEIKALFKDFEKDKINLLASFQTEREKYIDALHRRESGQPVFGERNKPKAALPAETAIDRKMRIKRERDEPQLGEKAEAAILEGAV